MVLIVKAKKGIIKLKEVLVSRQLKKKFDAKKFCSALKTHKDGFDMQKRLIDEWN